MADDVSRLEKPEADDGERAGSKLRKLQRQAAKGGAGSRKLPALRAVQPGADAPALRDVDASMSVREQDDEQSKVIRLVQRLQQDLNSNAGRNRRWPLISAVACILLPTLIAALYYWGIAADRYLAEARFAVRTNEAQAADVLGMVTGLPSNTQVSDSYIVTDYILSRDMVQKLEERLPLREMYSTPAADFLTRLDPTVTREGLVKYWNDRAAVFFDSTKNTIEVQAQAFTAADAERIVTAVVDIVRRLVNDLSAQARRDAVQFASGEVARAELRVRGARDDLIQFRATNKDFDPTQTASAALSIVAQLEGERVQLNSQLSAIAGQLAASAPSVQMLKSRIRALQQEIDRIQGEISASDKPRSDVSGAGRNADNLSTVIANYQELLLNQQFAETAYTAALGSLERARTEADRTQSYLAVYMQPDLPDDAAYPKRIRNILLVLFISAVAWAIGSLAFLTARDHIR